MRKRPIAATRMWEASLRRAVFFGVSIIAMLAFAPITAGQGASPLMEANRIYETGDIDGAIGAYDEALRVPGNEARDVLHMHRRLGLLRAATGDTTRARAHFAIAIAMAPNTPASAELSPELREHWEQTRAEQDAIDVRLEPLSNLSHTTSSELRVSVLNTPEGAVANIRVLVGSGEEDPWTTTLAGVGPVNFQLPPAAWRGERRVQVRVEALDQHGGVIAENRSSFNTAVIQTVTETRIREIDPPPETTEPTPEIEPATSVELVEPEPTVDLTVVPEDEPERSIWANPWFWTVTGVVLAGAATTAVLLVGSSTQPDYGAPILEFGGAR